MKIHLVHHYVLLCTFFVMTCLKVTTFYLTCVILGSGTFARQVHMPDELLRFSRSCSLRYQDQRRARGKVLIPQIFFFFSF